MLQSGVDRRYGEPEEIERRAGCRGRGFCRKREGRKERGERRGKEGQEGCEKEECGQKNRARHRVRGAALLDGHQQPSQQHLSSQSIGRTRDTEVFQISVAVPEPGDAPALDGGERGLWAGSEYMP